MPFVKMPGVIGKVYVPDKLPAAHQKHPCPDCFACQGCSDNRCNVCRSETTESKGPITPLPNRRQRSSTGPLNPTCQCHHNRKQPFE